MDRRQTVKKASFQILKGIRSGLVGGNGSGKTTIFRLITGRDEPDNDALASLLEQYGKVTEMFEVRGAMTLNTGPRWLAENLNQLVARFKPA